MPVEVMFSAPMVLMPGERTVSVPELVGDTAMFTTFCVIEVTLSDTAPAAAMMLVVLPGPAAPPVLSTPIAFEPAVTLNVPRVRREDRARSTVLYGHLGGQPALDACPQAFV